VGERRVPVPPFPRAPTEPQRVSGKRAHTPTLHFYLDTTAQMTVISRLMSHLTGQVKGDRLPETEVMSLLSNSEIPNPKWSSLGAEWSRRGGSNDPLTRVRPCAWAGLAEGSPEVGWAQEGNAWGKLCNYDYITTVMNNQGLCAWGRPNCYSERNMNKIKTTPFLQNGVVRSFRINTIVPGEGI
jgi:hypothetical protein